MIQSVTECKQRIGILPWSFQEYFHPSYMCKAFSIRENLAAVRATWSITTFHLEEV